ncbi:hypothetical protein PYW07_012167 [Mythimna separata]|uniref:unspecific monooxygenase n=1 Tax=Mythimna separata TaxID=271217 RepID=A0AAD7YMG9_MYTSE|nr:hypothetical protein PYW07_012167 [Mythimna separata]
MVRIYRYWRKRGVIGPTPYPVVGNYGTVIFGKESEGDFLKRIYEQYPNEKFVGLFKGVRPVLVIRDPDLIKCVLIKDYDCFTDRCLEKPVQVFNKSIFVMRGDQRWQAMRATLTPILTKSKIIRMIPFVQKAADSYINFLDFLVSNKIEREMHDLKTKYIVQIIGNLFFGVNLDAFHDNNEIQHAIDAALDPQLKSSPIHTISYVCPPIVNMLTPWIRREFDRRVFSAFRRFMMPLINKPRDSETSSPIFIDKFVDLKERSKIKNGRGLPEIDDDDIMQQVLTLSLASYETTATLLSFMIHELSLRQDIQAKCSEEVNNVFEKYNGKLTAEGLFEMKYLEMTMEETMRMHPSSHCIDRRCVAKYTLPDTDVTIDKGVFIFMPTHGLHRDPKYFPNPNVFDPERFSPENKVKIQPYVYLPFGDGPRKCLGIRASKLFVLLCLASFLRKYKVTPSAKTKQMKYDPSKLLALSALGGVWVNIEPRI